MYGKLKKLHLGNLYLICCYESNYLLTLIHVIDFSLQIGSDGSPCSHQHILWCKQLATCHNFLPVFSAKDRQNFARIAFGKCLNIEYYENLHFQRTPSNDDEIERNDMIVSITVHCHKRVLIDDFLS